MHITRELLIRYCQRLCTSGERATVEQWLQEAEHDMVAGEKPENEALLKSEMWLAIQQGINNKKKSVVFRRRLLYSVAACIAALIALTWWEPLLLSNTTVLKNDGSTTKTVIINQMEISVPAGSMCRIKTSINGTSASIKFCGAVSVLNKSESLTLSVFAEGMQCEGKGSDIIRLRRGQTYMAIIDSKYNLIAATGDELKDGLPKSFSYRLEERFKL